MPYCLLLVSGIYIAPLLSEVLKKGTSKVNEQIKIGDINYGTHEQKQFRLVVKLL